MAEARPYAIGELAMRDAAAVAKLQQQVMPHPWSERQFADSIEAGHRCLLVSTPPGEPVAVAVASRVMGEAELLTLATARQYQRSGVAAALLAALLQRLADEGAEVCFLEVMEGNTAALALYHSFGFALVGRRPGYYVLTDGKVDALLMRAVLTQY